jgi:outer membrane lipoprotein-sorting protein
MKKKYWLILLIILIIIGGIFFYKNRVKNSKSGNNKTSQEIVDYILNISSYEVQVTVNVTSNKNSNKYILKQIYQSPNKSMQEVIEPSNIEGVKIENDGTNLKIENSQLNLNKILENYNYLGDNCLDLYSFIEDYKQDNKSKFEEKDTEIIMKTCSNIDNIYIQEKILHIDKKTMNPTQMEIKDNKQKTTIYILYNEVKVNSTM